MTKRTPSATKSQTQASQAPRAPQHTQSQSQISVGHPQAQSQSQVPGPQKEAVFKPGKKKSEVWNHFHYKTNEDGSYSNPPMAVCNHCKIKEYPCGSKNYGTTNMRHHIFNACLKSPVRKEKGDFKAVYIDK